MRTALAVATLAAVGLNLYLRGYRSGQRSARELLAIRGRYDRILEL